jgi:antitoxin (DNA-binding transcriptional repressor) of toxin-antitoxin stability system/predicted nucleic acid-binding protein
MTADLLDLQGRIAEYIARVRRGETVFITDDEKIIAKLEPVAEAEIAEDEQAWIDDLVRRGIATAPAEQMTPQENERLIAELLNSPPARHRRGRPPRARGGAVRFWDTSALVPACAPQPTTKIIAGGLRADPRLVLWTLTPVELTSAVQRLVRDGALSTAEAVSAETRADHRFRSALFIRDTEEAKTVARSLLQTHPLRAADALQLAAALLWANRKPMRRVFYTFDDRLAEAARKEGFTVPVTRASRSPVRAGRERMGLFIGRVVCARRRGAAVNGVASFAETLGGDRRYGKSLAHRKPMLTWQKDG